MAKGKYLPKDNPARLNRDEYILSLHYQGFSQKEIAKKAKVSQPTVCRAIQGNTDEILIEKLQNIYKATCIEHLPIAYRNRTEFLTSDHMPELKFRATEKVMEQMYGRNTQDAGNTYILNDNRSVTVENNREMAEFMKFRHLKRLPGGETVDAEYTTDSGENIAEPQ